MILSHKLNNSLNSNIYLDSWRYPCSSIRHWYLSINLYCLWSNECLFITLYEIIKICTWWIASNLETIICRAWVIIITHYKSIFCQLCLYSSVLYTIIICPCIINRQHIGVICIWRTVIVNNRESLFLWNFTRCNVETIWNS